MGPRRTSDCRARQKDAHAPRTDDPRAFETREVSSGRRDFHDNSYIERMRVLPYSSLSTNTAIFCLSSKAGRGIVHVRDDAALTRIATETKQATGAILTYGAADLSDEGAGPKSTLASTVYHQLRDDLLRGVLETESKLRVEWVVSRYGAGASPVREALNRLASEGLLGRHDQRGFFIMPVSAPELEELTRTRCWLEERALRESIAHRTAEWEEQLVLALHRLARAPAPFAGGSLVEQSGLGKAASRLPSGADLGLPVALAGRFLRPAFRSGLPLPADVARTARHRARRFRRASPDRRTHPGWRCRWRRRSPAQPLPPDGGHVHGTLQPRGAKRSQGRRPARRCAAADSNTVRWRCEIRLLRICPKAIVLSFERHALREDHEQSPVRRFPRPHAGARAAADGDG